MSKVKPLIACLIAAAPLVPAGAAVLGPHAGDCADGKPAMLVRIDGLKSRAGTLRVQSYGGNPDRYFDKGAYLERVEVHIPPAGPVEVCMPVPRAGLYAISVRHDADGRSGTSVHEDGGGFSGNPNVSLFDVLFKRKPSPAQVQIRVAGVTRVPVTLNYVHGTSVGPIRRDM